MTATTILHEAELELWEAVEYYESRSPGLGLVPCHRNWIAYTGTRRLRLKSRGGWAWT